MNPKKENLEVWYRFKRKSDGWTTVSRHLTPDFCYGKTREEIDNEFDIEEVPIGSD